MNVHQIEKINIKRNIKNMKHVLDKWMDDYNRWVEKSEEYEKESEFFILSQVEVNNMFCMFEYKLTQFYKDKEEKKNKQYKTEEELYQTRVEALFLPDLMLTHLIDKKIGSVGTLSRLSQEELMILFLEDYVSIALIIDALDEFGAPHNFIKTY